MGLLSDGGVHSHIDHVIALLEMAQRQGVEKVYLHAFLDGRDVLPTSALEFLDHMQSEMTKRNTGKIATIIGRYYAMNRDKRWERLEVAYRALVFREGVLSSDYHDAMKQSYDNGITDEFVKPIIMEDGAGVSSGDAVIFLISVRIAREKCSGLSKIPILKALPVVMSLKRITFASLSATLLMMYR